MGKKSRAKRERHPGWFWRPDRFFMEVNRFDAENQWGLFSNRQGKSIFRGGIFVRDASLLSSFVKKLYDAATKEPFGPTSEDIKRGIWFKKFEKDEDGNITIKHLHYRDVIKEPNIE